MEHAIDLEAYGLVARRLALLSLAYPRLEAVSAAWERLPGGHPIGLSREARYVLFAYRALRAAHNRFLAACGTAEDRQRFAALRAEAAFAAREAVVALGEPFAPPIAELRGGLMRAVA